VEGVEVSTSKDTKNTKAISAGFIPQKMNPLYLSLSLPSEIEETEHNLFYKRRGRRAVVFLKRTKIKCSLDPRKS
jgi:hypothetical protein